MTKYAGIGSRETPADVLDNMTNLAMFYADMGYWLRSGGAKGADTFFEYGADEAEAYDPTRKEIFTANDCTPEAREFSSQYHPNWGACKPWARNLHGRNAMILMGRNLDDPVDFVVCWTPDAKLSGGTAQGIRIAQAHDIPVYNLGNPELLGLLRTIV